MIDAGVIQAGALAGRAALHVTIVVLHEYGVVIKALKAFGSQQMRQFVGARFVLLIRDRLAGAGHNKCGPLRMLNGVLCWIHSLPLTHDSLERLDTNLCHALYVDTFFSQIPHSRITTQWI